MNDLCDHATLGWRAVEGARKPERGSPVDFAVLVRRLRRPLRRTLGSGIDFETRIADNLSMIEADPAQVERLLVELSLNSGDTMERGGRLLIEAENADLDDEYAHAHPDVQPGCYVRIKVSGAGMSPESLRTAHGIVTRSRGRIDIYSGADIGATAKVHLPVSGAAAARAKPAERRYRTGKGEVVLVIEDEADAKQMAGRILTKAGYRVIDAPMAPTALGALQHVDRPVDVLLTDVVGAKLGGDVLADRARELRPDLRILYTSGYSRVVLNREATGGSDGSAFIEKPFSARALLRTVRRLLDAPCDRATRPTRPPAAPAPAPQAAPREARPRWRRSPRSARPASIQASESRTRPISPATPQTARTAPSPPRSTP